NSSGLKPPRNDKREAVWRPSVPLRAGSEVVSFQKRTSRDARAYIDNGARAGTLAPTSTTAHERGGSRLHRRPRTSGGRSRLHRQPHAGGTLAPTSTTVRGRGRPRHTRRGPGRGVSRTPSLKSREDRHPPLTAESNSSAENLGHSPEGGRIQKPTLPLRASNVVQAS